MSSSVEASLILKVVDELTGPSKAVAAALDHMQKEFAQTAARSRVLAKAGTEMRQQSQAFSTAVGQMRTRMDSIRRSFAMPVVPRVDLTGFMRSVAASAGLYFGIRETLDATVNSARRAQAALSEIGIKDDLSDVQLGSLHRGLLALAPQVNQTTEDLIAGVDAMVTLGLKTEDAAAAMPAIGRAATATKSGISDLSSATVSAMQNMNVAASEVERMLDGMASAGNAGAFEMRDMAQYFPQLTASARALGMEGVNSVTDLAAALQIARRGAGDASTAANNMSNFLGKIMSPEVAKRFKKFGVDVTEELKKAHKQGISPLEHFMELVDEKTKGGRADLLGQLFGDKQVLDFVRPMLADFKDYIRIRTDAERASGTVAQAYARRMQDANERLKAFQIRLSNSGALIGVKLLEPIAQTADYFARIFDTMEQRVTVFDRASAAIKSFTAGLGLDPDTSAFKQVGDFLFGVETSAVKAGEELGRVAAQWRKIGEEVRAMIDSVTQGQSAVSERFKALSASFGELSISPMTIATILGASFALKKIVAVAAGIALSSPIRLGALAWGLTSLADGGASMSAVDWAALGIGLTTFAGGLGKVIAGLNRLKAVAGVLGRLSPYIAMLTLPGDTPKETQPANWEDDPRAARWKREALMLGQGPGTRVKDDDVWAGKSRHEREIGTTPDVKVPLLEMPPDPTVFNRLIGEMDRVTGEAKQKGMDWRRFFFGAAAEPDFNLREHFRIETDGMAADSVTAGDKIQKALSITAMPIVDSSSIDATLRKAAALRSMLGGITPGGAAAPPTPGLSKFGGPRAEGGPVARGMRYLVGEEGPELFTPGSSGTITPNHALGGTSVTIGKIDIHVSGAGDPRAVADAVSLGLMQKLDAQLMRSRQINLDGRSRYEFA